MLEDVKNALRVSGTDLDIEIKDLIEAAKLDLAISGVNVEKTIEITEVQTPEPAEENPEPEPVEVTINVVDPLIKRAITVYCKAHFGYDDQAERLQKSYDALKNHLALSAEYTEVVL